MVPLLLNMDMLIRLQYDHLAHALLGLGASHLGQNTNVDYTAQSLKHRGAAIRLVNEQLNQPAKNVPDGDALFATVVILTAQSSLLPDAMVEYLTMTRGANLIATSIMPDFNESIFSSFSQEGHIESLSKMIYHQPKDLDLIEKFRSSALMLEVICSTPFEVEYVASMLRCISLAATSSLDGQYRLYLHTLCLA